MTLRLAQASSLAPNGDEGVKMTVRRTTGKLAIPAATADQNINRCAGRHFLAKKEPPRADRLAHPYPQSAEPGQAVLAGTLSDDARERAGGP